MTAFIPLAAGVQKTARYSFFLIRFYFLLTFSSGIECLYTEKRKPGLKPGFGKELVDRIDKLESVVVENLGALRNIDRLEAVLLETARSVRNLESSWRSNFSNPASNHAASAIAAASAVVDATPAVEPVYHPSPATSCHDSSLSSEPTQYLQQQPQQSIPSLSVAETQSLPPYNILLKLVRLFFEHINAWFPIFDAQDVWSRIFTSDSTFNSENILVYAIVAASLRFLPSDDLSESDKLHYHTAASQKLTLLTLEIPNLESLEAMVIMAIDVVGTSNGPKCWPILAMICSIALKLGLNHDRTMPSSGAITPSNNHEGISTAGVPIIPESEDSIIEERRRRLFWGIYLLDRYSSVGSSFIFNIPSSEVRRRLPFLSETTSRAGGGRGGGGSEDRLPSEFSSWFAYNSGYRKSPVGTNTSSTGDVNNAGSASPATDEIFIVLEPFAYELELLGIISAIHEFLRKPVNINSKHDSERWQIEYRKFNLVLDEWRLRLPDDFSTTEKIVEKLSDSGTKLDPVWIILHSLYHTAVIRINSAAGYPYKQSANFKASPESRSRSLVAVSNIVELAHVLSTDPQRFYKCVGPHYAFTLWVAGRLSIVHCFMTVTMLTDDIATLVKTLAGIGEYWQVAKRYSDLLLFVIEEGWLSKMRRQAGLLPGDVGEDTSSNSDRTGLHELSNGGITSGKIDSPGGDDTDDEDEKTRMVSAKILSDMRRTASDLDFLLSKNKSDNVAAAAAKWGSTKRNVSNNSLGLNVEHTSPSVPQPPTAVAETAVPFAHSDDSGSGDSLVDQLLPNSLQQAVETFATPLALQEFSPTHQFDMANFFEWFNWLKASDAPAGEMQPGGQRPELNVLTASGLGDITKLEWMAEM